MADSRALIEAVTAAAPVRAVAAPAAALSPACVVRAQPYDYQLPLKKTALVMIGARGRGAQARLACATNVGSPLFVPLAGLGQLRSLLRPAVL